jgi:hypothetical protein
MAKGGWPGSRRRDARSYWAHRGGRLVIDEQRLAVRTMMCGLEIAVEKCERPASRRKVQRESKSFSSAAREGELRELEDVVYEVVEIPHHRAASKARVGTEAVVEAAGGLGLEDGERGGGLFVEGGAEAGTSADWPRSRWRKSKRVCREVLRE